jgi:spore coat protein A
MRFRVTRRGRDDSAVPDQLTSIELLNPSDAAQLRSFEFRTVNQNGRHMWTVNGQLFDPSGSVANPRFGTVERWRFSIDFHHPIHLHLAHFQVLSRNGGHLSLATAAGRTQWTSGRTRSLKCSPVSTATAAAT